MNRASIREPEDGRIGLGGSQRSGCLLDLYICSNVAGRRRGVAQKAPSLGLTNCVHTWAEMRGFWEMSLPSWCSYHLDNRFPRISSPPFISLGPPGLPSEGCHKNGSDEALQWQPDKEVLSYDGDRYISLRENNMYQVSEARIRKPRVFNSKQLCHLGGSNRREAPWPAWWTHLPVRKMPFQLNVCSFLSQK